MTTVFYLHGFASSPKKSRKADYLEKNCKKWDITFCVPDLNVPRYDRLTLTAQINHLSDEIRKVKGDIYIVASSMGALAALHLMERGDQTTTRRVKGMLFLAPSFDFVESRRHLLGNDALERWKEEGWMTVYNYNLEKNVKISYDLMSDILKYDSYNVNTKVPIYIIHGKKDNEVPYTQSVRFAENKENVTLHLVESDHSLSSEKQYIWSTIAQILRLYNNYRNREGIIVEEFDLNRIEGRHRFEPYEAKFLAVLEASYRPFFGKEAHKIRMRDTTLFLAFQEKHHVDSLVGGSYSKQNGKLSALAVLPEYRRQGIGRCLVCFSLRRFMKQFTEIAPANTIARNLMLSIGFIDVMNENEIQEYLAHTNAKITSITQHGKTLVYERKSTRCPGERHEFVLLTFQPEISV